MIVGLGVDIAEVSRIQGSIERHGEHFLPLLYVAGACLPDDQTMIFSDTIEGALSMTSVAFGDTALAREGA